MLRENEPTMNVSAWWLLVAAVPIVLLGEAVLNALPALARLDLPPAIVGGLLVAATVLGISALRRSTSPHVVLETTVSSSWYDGLIAPTPLGKAASAQPVYLPFSTAFFTCVGLSASWRVARRGSWRLLLYLALATLLGELQNLLGIALCQPLHVSPLLGLICGSLTLTGGPSTALGFAPAFVQAGFPDAAVVGAAAAMFGIVAACILSGTAGGQLIRWRKLQPAKISVAENAPLRPRRATLLQRLQRLRQANPATVLLHLLLLLVLMKLGAWLSFGISQLHISLPVYMGALLLGIVVRNSADFLHLPLHDEIIQILASLLLAMFLAMAMASLNLAKLAALAGPMLAILAAQVVLMLAFALAITYMAMGRDYDAAMLAAGHVGFGLGITPNAVASVDVLEQKFGPSPQAMLLVTLVGGFLIDITNSILITTHLNLIK